MVVAGVEPVGEGAVGLDVLAGRRPEKLTEPSRLRVAVSLRSPVLGVWPDAANRDAVAAAARLLVGAGHDTVTANPVTVEGATPLDDLPAAVEIPRTDARDEVLDALTGTGIRAKLRTGGTRERAAERQRPAAERRQSHVARHAFDRRAFATRDAHHELHRTLQAGHDGAPDAPRRAKDAPRRAKHELEHDHDGAIGAPR